jgi:nucleolar GTP-binding protein
MNFQNLQSVEKAEWYIDLAFRQASKVAQEYKSQKRPGPEVIKDAELAKIREIRKTLTRHLALILKSFPSIDSLPEFYQELIRTTLDYAELKTSLGSLRWAQQKIEIFTEQYVNKVKRCMDFKRMLAYSREYYGRISSVMNQVKKQLLYLEHARRTMKAYPSIKEKIFTVAIAGFPNVGKTTLLSKLTGSKPEIANYAFTTKNLNVGYATLNNQKVQFIDTPGTLDRFEKMNPVERQAYLAMKYCADVIIFVFDPSDQAYDPVSQKKLLASTDRFGKKVFIYISKTDVTETAATDKLAASLKKTCASGIMKDAESLKTAISSLL